MMTPDTENRRRAITVFCYGLLAYGLLISTREALAMQSADLFATWLAGTFLAMGQVDQVYPQLSGVFDMTTPDAWWPYVAASDADARVFPYIYPPLWAALVRPLTGVMSFAAFDTAMLALHQILLLGTIWLALGMCGLRGLTRLVAFAATYVALVVTLPMGIALGENQPQIIVSFLIVAAFAGAQADRSGLGGVLLALAAAIKVYPLLFIVIFAARRDWAAVKGFVVAGGALATFSVVLAGWPLHAEYLSLLSVVSKSVIVTNFSFSIDAGLATSAFVDHLQGVTQPSQADSLIGWSALAKTPLWAALSMAAQIAGLLAIAWVAAKRPNDPLVLPLAVTLFAALSPLSWAYTYLPAFVFLAAVPLRIGAIGWAVLAGFIVLFHPLVAFDTLSTPFGDTSVFHVTGLVFIAISFAAFAAATLRQNDRPLAHPSAFDPDQSALAPLNT